MTLNVLFATREVNQSEWFLFLRKAFDDVELDVSLIRETSCPESIDYIITSPNGTVQDFAPFVNLRAILNLWAGVENMIHNQTIHCPLIRMNDPGMIEGMTEWVTAQVLRHHLNMDIHIQNNTGRWLKDTSPPLARTRHVGVLGLGVLGGACAQKIASLKFNVLGWSRTPKKLPNVRSYSGEDGFNAVLGLSDILVLLMPLTPLTENIINRDSLCLCKTGTVLINSGRGGLIDEDALLEALDSGQVSHATLDVFKQEPLPPSHPFWQHEKVSVWPHISSETRPLTASTSIAMNILKDQKGELMSGIVDFSQGY